MEVQTICIFSHSVTFHCLILGMLDPKKIFSPQWLWNKYLFTCVFGSSQITFIFAILKSIMHNEGLMTFLSCANASIYIYTDLSPPPSPACFLLREKGSCIIVSFHCKGINQWHSITQYYTVHSNWVNFVGAVLQVPSLNNVLVPEYWILS